MIGVPTDIWTRSLTFNDVSEEKDWPIEVNTDALE